MSLAKEYRDVNLIRPVSYWDYNVVEVPWGFSLFLSISNNIYNGPETYFDSNYLYNYVFFREDLKEGWQKFFHKDFPHIVDYKEKDDLQKEML